MTDEKFNFILTDVCAKIQGMDEQHNIREFGIISTSWGLDSTVLSAVVDIALPENKIPRLFINTGIEYNEMLKFANCMNLRIILREQVVKGVLLLII